MASAGKVTLLAYEMMKEHGIPEWLFVVNARLKRSLGRCIYKSKTIDMSYDFIRGNNLDRIKVTLCHEIAHALTRGHKHDNVWLAKFHSMVKYYGLLHIHNPANEGKFCKVEHSLKYTLVSLALGSDVIENHGQRARRTQLTSTHSINGLPKTKGRLAFVLTESYKQYKAGDTRLVEQLRRSLPIRGE